MRIGVVGGGVVGRATAQAFLGHVDEVRVYDVVRERATHTLPETLDTDLIMVCLPTPQKEGGGEWALACNTSVVELFFESHAVQARRDRNYVLRSTVPIGCTRRLAHRCNLPSLVHSPEFLTARTAEHDAANPTRNIIGVIYSKDANGEAVASNAVPCREMLCQLYRERFPHIPVHPMTSDESEAVKLFQNAFSAVKIATFNEFRTLADELGLCWDRVVEALLAGGWINPQHTQVPGRDGWGFRGSCLPKDLANLITCLADAGLPMHMTMAAHTRNQEDRRR